MSFISKLEPRVLYSLIYNDIYWSKENGLKEKEYVFIEGNQLKKRWATKKENFTIFELGFGAGLNFLMTKKTWEECKPNSILHYISAELHPIPKSTLHEILYEFYEIQDQVNEFLEQYPENFFKIHRLEFQQSKIFLTLWIGDVLDALKELYFYADAFFLDGFSPAKNPEMWSKEIFTQIKYHSKEFSTFSTYSVSKIVKENALANGFEIQTLKGFGNKKEMLVGKIYNSTICSLSKKYFPIPKPLKNPNNITIIGAGITGLCLGYSFRLRNKKVTIVDENLTLGANASSNPLGYFFPKLAKKITHSSELSLLGTNFTSSRIIRWNKEFNKKIGENTGVYIYFKDLEERKEFYNSFYSHNLNENLLEEKEIEILGKNETYLHLKLGGYFKPLEFCKLMFEELSKTNVNFLFGKRVQKFTFNQNWQLWDEKGNLLLETEILILANSFGVLDFLQTEHLPFQKVRGQICFLPNNLKLPENSPFLTKEIYLISVENVSLLGATFNPFDSNPDPNPQHNELLLHRLQNSGFQLPFLNPHELHAKVGFRANTKDRLPILGAIPIIEQYLKDYKNFQKGYKDEKFPQGKTYPNLFVLSGMGSKGISYAPILAESLVSLVCEETPPISISILESLHPARFIMRDIIHKRIL